MELFICKEFQELIPPQQLFEYQQLEENILRDGCTTPLDVWRRNGKLTIVDGHHRYKICKERNIPFETHEVNFDSDDDAKIWIIRNQFGRRNLSNFHRAELALVLEPLIAAKAKERQLAGLKQNHTVRENSHEREQEARTDETLAQISGVSSNTIRRAKIIKNQGTPEQIERARSGKSSVNAVYTEIRHRDIKEKTCPMCGKTLPIDRFYGEGATCKTCTETRKQVLLAGGTVSYAKPDTQRESRGAKPPEMARAISEASESLRDSQRTTEHTVADLEESLSSLVDDFISKVRRSIQIYKDDFGVFDAKVVSDSLHRAICALDEIMGGQK